MIVREVDAAIYKTDYLYVRGNVLPLFLVSDINLIILETTLTSSTYLAAGIPAMIDINPEPDCTHCQGVLIELSLMWILNDQKKRGRYLRVAINKNIF